MTSRTSDLQQSLDRLRQAQDQLILSEKLASLGGLVAGIAHEINTPLGIGVTAASHMKELAARMDDIHDADDPDAARKLQRQIRETADILLRRRPWTGPPMSAGPSR